MVKRGRKPGFTITEKHRRAMRKGRRNSEACHQHYVNLKTILKGRKPVPLAIARSRATRRVEQMGLSREAAPQLWQGYVQYYLKLKRKWKKEKDGSGRNSASNDGRTP